MKTILAILLALASAESVKAEDFNAATTSKIQGVNAVSAAQLKRMTEFKEKMDRAIKALDAMPPSQGKLDILEALHAGAEAVIKVDGAEIKTQQNALIDTLHEYAQSLDNKFSFKIWEDSDHLPLVLAEFSRPDVIKIFQFIKEPLPSGDDGKPIDSQKVTLLSPAGLRYVGSSGNALVPFDSLSPRVKELMGWSRGIEYTYTKLKEEEGKLANSKAQQAYIDQLKAENTGKKPSTGTSRVVSRQEFKPYNVGSIRERAIKEWPNDYSMQEYTIKQQTKAKNDMDKLIGSGYRGVPHGVFDKIVAKARDEWNEDYTMQVYSVKKECDAYLRLSK